MQPGGTQEALKPVAILSLLLYTVGLPLAFFAVLVYHRGTIYQDQVLRQQNQGNTPASNPNFSVRQRYQELYRCRGHCGLPVRWMRSAYHVCTAVCDVQLFDNNTEHCVVAQHVQPFPARGVLVAHAANAAEVL